MEMDAGITFFFLLLFRLEEKRLNSVKKGENRNISVPADL